MLARFNVGAKVKNYCLVCCKYVLEILGLICGLVDWVSCYIVGPDVK